MPTRLNPYITFGGNARGNSPEMHDKLMHSMLTVSHGVTLMGADMPDSSGPKGSPTSVSLSGEDADELRGWYDGLSAGGEIIEPFDKAPWGDYFGVFNDRFGVHWMFNGGAAPE